MKLGRIVSYTEKLTPLGVKLIFPVVCLLFGFVWGFITHMSISAKDVEQARQAGYDKRDAEAYRGLHPVTNLKVLHKYSNLHYDLESDGGTLFKTNWCEPIDLEEGWIIESGLFEIRGNCLSLQLGDKGQLKIKRVPKEFALR